MIRRLLFVIAVFAFLAAPAIAEGRRSPIHVLAFYSTDVERDHVDFAEDAVKFFAATRPRGTTLTSSPQQTGTT